MVFDCGDWSEMFHIVPLWARVKMIENDHDRHDPKGFGGTLFSDKP